jgi:hypothetical protein
MCGLCGILGNASHWTDGPADGDVGALQNRRAARLARVRMMNEVLAPFGLKLSDWQGSDYLLSGSTGRTEVVGDLVQVWRAAQQMSGRVCDPLDLQLIERLELRT